MRPQDRRPQIDPKTLHKRRPRPAPIAVAHEPEEVVVRTSDRVLAPAGSVEAPGGRIREYSKCRGFETLVRFIRAGQITETVVNPKKDRSIRVLEGECFVAIKSKNDDGEDTEELVRLRTEDEKFIPAGHEHRIIAVAGAVNVLITQAYKYDVAMEETAPAEISAASMSPATRREAVASETSNGLPPRRPRGLQKAAQQNAAMFEEFKPNAVVQAPPPLMPAGGEVQVNARPTGGGEFDPSMAG